MQSGDTQVFLNPFFSIPSAIWLISTLAGHQQQSLLDYVSETQEQFGCCGKEGIEITTVTACAWT